MSYLKDMFKIETEGYKSLYELYYELYLSKKSELDNTIKIFNKKKILKLQNELKDLKNKSDKYFDLYIGKCEELYKEATK